MFPKIVVPQSGWFMMENPINPWTIWGYHYFRKHPNRSSASKKKKTVALEVACAMESPVTAKQIKQPVSRFPISTAFQHKRF